LKRNELKILALDTSTEACSAALLIDKKIDVRFEIAPQQHSQLILPMCEDLLRNANITVKDLSAIAFARGPGSFTGLRIAAGVTQGIAFGADLPVIGISTLEALAYEALSKHPKSTIISAIDARMREVYWAEYSLNNSNSIIATNSERVGKPDTVFSTSLSEVVAIGSGWKVYEKELSPLIQEKNISFIYSESLPSAEQIAQLAVKKWLNKDLLSAEQALPVYLRNDVAKKSVVKE